MIDKIEHTLLLGIDVGTSSIKVSVVDAETQRSVASATFPENTEREIKSPKPDWAEQSPEQWWSDVKAAIKQTQSINTYNPENIVAIGITYQMHGLVIVDKEKNVLRDSIIWCDSRTEKQAEKGLQAIGEEKALSHLLNFPGNFTASKLAWVKHNEPQVYEKIDKFMLPGDYIAMKLTGEITSTISMLSEGVFWDFKNKELSKDILSAYDFDESVFPETKALFGVHGNVTKEIAKELNIPAEIPVTYKAGDQPNNALSLNVFEPGEIAATAGTSGVIYAVADDLVYDKLSRINTFAHVNHTNENNRLGVLLCINGTGISNRWIKNMVDEKLSYQEINELASTIEIGSEGLLFLPFGNGTERMLCNKHVGAGFSEINFNIHNKAHLFRAVQEGIAFSFRYGLDIMRENGMQTKVVKAGKANMFLSKVFTHAFVNTTGLTVELYNTDGSVGAALGAGIGLGIFEKPQDAFSKLELLETIEPDEESVKKYEAIYRKWKSRLNEELV
ncbi:carbohydrate kinase [Arachidicoccus ginsenosidimutans]|uniref:xylulokinase n=1 Tax=Arachidicoccus sp. BS20 TaxID=1850526 RepID=UPI0007F0C825|nr:FGGY family carbohydrate kinase [Arachidicoccus sp. BS20]ANI88784.1 carbohydrate kinase [Arachidicoccus sp. BS20]